MMVSFIQNTLLLFLIFNLSPACSFLSKPSIGRHLSPFVPDQQQQTKKKKLPPPTATTTELQLQSPASTVAISMVGHVVGGILGVPFVASAINSWYSKIELPTWTPPNRIFSPVWTTLYAAMGLAVARVYNTTAKSAVLGWWCLHYALNLSWAPLFFGCQRLWGGFWLNVVLTSSVPWFMVQFAWLGDTVAAGLFLPYLIWLVFATALNLRICQLNPGPYNNARFQADLSKLQRRAAAYADGA
mmetsp:Transcript_31237/g.47251  ORF Transcript_31237/g.47251 Transcript_31237/m.47251 type:complete len:243 (-) Transcript_31237:157-885(-)